MIYTLFIGFLFGLRHALDADHIAAVAALATRSRNSRETIRMGLAWGVGHALTLFLVCAVVLALDFGFPERVAHTAEFLVGVMLVVLGIDVIRRALRERMHVHAHRHGGGEIHAHVHSHQGEAQHRDSAHTHAHRAWLPRRALLVGLMHGLAGSAALLLLSVGAAGSLAFGLVYVALFGIGSMAGMAALSLTIALPLRTFARSTTWALNGLNFAVGAGTAVIGGMLILETGPAAASWLTAL
jgi:ABC-type nickel/cobalt efflux system permease component RcnA